MSTPEPSAPARLRTARWLIVLALGIALWAGSRGITREGAFYSAGDAPRYLMNGVFILDALQSDALWTPRAWPRFAEHYYARYPALSLGHHPPLVPAALVPYYAVFGVSVMAARLAMLSFFLLAVWLISRVGRRYYDDAVGGWAAVLLASSPIIGRFASLVLSEIPTLALALLALVCIERFRASGRFGAYVLVLAACVASLLARPTAVYMFPAYAYLLARDGGWGRLTRGRVALANAVGLVLVALAVLAYAALSPFNAMVVVRVLQEGITGGAVLSVLGALLAERPLAWAAAGGLLVAAVTRDRRALPPVAWALSVIACTIVLTGSIEPRRYSILAVPALCVIGASLASAARTSVARVAIAIGLLAAAGLQVTDPKRRGTSDAPGYEEAARYVVGAAAGPTVLYSAEEDTGYFVFFVRKHDAARRLVILRSDKLLTTSRMSRLSVEVRISKPEDIYGLLERYGTRLVVIEDRPTGVAALEWLRTLVKSDRFVERRRIPIGTRAPGVDLIVYEYLDATSAAPDAELDINLPVVARRITVPLADLVGPPATR